MTAKELEKALEPLTQAISEIASGGTSPHSVPMGLEALSMSIEGETHDGKVGRNSLSLNLEKIADAINRDGEDNFHKIERGLESVSTSLESVADAILKLASVVHEQGCPPGNIPLGTRD